MALLNKRRWWRESDSKVQQAVVTLFLLVILIVPLGYLAIILDVLTHEVLGHGLASSVLGGSFSGFDIQLDGMGRAYVQCETYPRVMLLAGIMAEFIIGLALLVIAVRSSRVRLARICFGVFSFVFLINASSYGFWNSVFPRPPGDLGYVLMVSGSGVLRWVFVVVFGLALILCSLAANLFFFRCVESLVGGFTKHTACVTVVFLAMGGLANAAFDWNQLIEGVGTTPQTGGMILQCLTCLWLFRCGP